MKTSPADLSLIKQFGVCEPHAYKCPAGVLTVGYDHTGSDVTPGLVTTVHRAEELLQLDLSKFEKAVAASIKVSVIANQFAALVALAYNIGPAALAKSTPIKRLRAGKTQPSDYTLHMEEHRHDNFPYARRAGIEFRHTGGAVPFKLN